VPARSPRPHRSPSRSGLLRARGLRPRACPPPTGVRRKNPRGEYSVALTSRALARRRQPPGEPVPPGAYQVPYGVSAWEPRSASWNEAHFRRNRVNRETVITPAGRASTARGAGNVRRRQSQSTPGRQRSAKTISTGIWRRPQSLLRRGAPPGVRWYEKRVRPLPGAAQESAGRGRPPRPRTRNPPGRTTPPRGAGRRHPSAPRCRDRAEA